MPSDPRIGHTALHLAVMSTSNCIGGLIKLLLQNGALPDTSNWFGHTAVHLFCAYQLGPATIIYTFAEHGANLNLRGNDGTSALHLAVGKASSDVCIALVKCGACLHIRDLANRTPLQLAEDSGGRMVVSMVLAVTNTPINDRDKSVECYFCKAVFTIVRRRIHCTNCGISVCKCCGSNLLPLPKFELESPVPLCQLCFDVLSFRRVK